jgi:ADP-ribose pyrophosphatase
MKAIVHDRKVLHKGRVFSLTRENLTLSNGFKTDMDIIRHPGAAAIVAVTVDQHFLMLRQYRHAVGKTLWEIPAGTLEAGEPPLSCAQRELAEETGFSARQWQPLGAITPVPSYSDERIHLFLARDLLSAKQHLDVDEIIQVQKLPLATILNLIGEGSIEDAKTISAIFLAKQKLDSLSKANSGP